MRGKVPGPLAGDGGDGWLQNPELPCRSGPGLSLGFEEKNNINTISVVIAAMIPTEHRLRVERVNASRGGFLRALAWPVCASH